MLCFSRKYSSFTSVTENGVRYICGTKGLSTERFILLQDKIIVKNRCFGVINGALSGVNKSELNELENKVFETIKINPNLKAKEISENYMIPFRSV